MVELAVDLEGSRSRRWHYLPVGEDGEDSLEEGETPPELLVRDNDAKRKGLGGADEGQSLSQLQGIGAENALTHRRALGLHRHPRASKP